MLRAAYKLAGHAGDADRLSAQQRRRWGALLQSCRAQYWPALRPEGQIRLGRRVRRGGGGYMLRGRVSDGSRQRDFWIKWCPTAEDAVLARTADHMRWWRALHPGLAGPVAKLLAYWPEDKVLLIEGRSGEPLGRQLSADRAGRQEPAFVHLATMMTRLARWLRAYSVGLGQYGPDSEGHCGAQVRRSSDGRLMVNARELLAMRVERAEEAAHTLRRAGLAAAGRWSDRFDLDGIIRLFTDSEPAGFIHGDLKPDNVLIGEDDFAVIDWWDAPRVSWPLTDAATLAGNLWLDIRFPGAGVAWSSFARGYFSARIDERTRMVIDLVGTMMCLGFLASKVQHGVLSGLIAWAWCRRVVNRLVDANTIVGAVR